MKKFAKSVSSCWDEGRTRYEVFMCRLLNHIVFAARHGLALMVAGVLAAATEGESAVERRGVAGMVKCAGQGPVTVALVRFGNRLVLSRPAKCVFVWSICSMPLLCRANRPFGRVWNTLVIARAHASKPFTQGQQWTLGALPVALGKKLNP